MLVELTIKEYLEIIAGRVNEADKIVTDLLNLSRTRQADRQEVEVDRLEVDLGNALEIRGGGGLTIAHAANRPLSGVILNDGQIFWDVGSEFSGTGNIVGHPNEEVLLRCPDSDTRAPGARNERAFVPVME